MNGQNGQNARTGRSRLADAAVVSTAAIPFVLSALFRRRGARLSRVAEKVLHSGNAKKISLDAARKAGFREKLLWDKAGYTFKPLSIAEQNVPGFADLSHFVFDPARREGGIRIGVKSIADAHKNGISSDMFFHELGHAHEAYDKQPKSVLGMLWKNFIGKNLMPLKWNPKYKEEVRAWNNAKKLSGGTIDDNVMNAALDTYRNGVYSGNAVTWSGLGSAALIGSRLKRPSYAADASEKIASHESMTTDAYRRGFLTKCSEYGIDSNVLFKYASTRLAKMVRSGKLGQKSLQRLADALGGKTTAQDVVNEYVSRHNNGKNAGRLISEFKKNTRGNTYSNLGEYLKGTMFPDEISKLTGVTHNIRGDQFVKDLQSLPDSKSKEVGDFISTLITNEGLPLKRMRFNGAKPGTGDADNLLVGGFARKMMGSKKRFFDPGRDDPISIWYASGDKEPFRNIVKAPEGGAATGGRLFTGDYRTVRDYSSPITGYMGDTYILKDLAGNPLSMSDMSLGEMVRRGMPQHVADSVSARSKDGFVPGERTIRNYISKNNFAPNGKRTEFIRDAGGKLDDITHVGVDIPYDDYFSVGLSPKDRFNKDLPDLFRHNEGAKLMFRQSGARSQTAAHTGTADSMRSIIQELVDPRVKVDPNAVGYSFYNPKITRMSDIAPKTPPPIPVPKPVVPPVSSQSIVSSKPKPVITAQKPATHASSVASSSTKPPAKPVIASEKPKPVVSVQGTHTKELESLLAQRAEKVKMLDERSSRFDAQVSALRKQLRDLSSNKIKAVLNRGKITEIKAKIRKFNEMSLDAFKQARRIEQTLKWD